MGQIRKQLVLLPKSHAQNVRRPHTSTRGEAGHIVGGGLPIYYSLCTPEILDQYVHVADLLDCGVPVECKAGVFAYLDQRARRIVLSRRLDRHRKTTERRLLKREGKPARCLWQV